MVRWFLYSWISCWLLVAMAESTTPTNTLTERLVDKLIYQSGWYQEFFGKDKREDIVPPPPKEEIPSIVTPKAVEIPQGYTDTDTLFGRDVEPFNMEVVSRIEGGDLVLNSKDPHLYVNPVSKAVGPYQVKPKAHSDVGNLRWYGATNLRGPKDYDTGGKQRGHSNRYLTSLLGKYEDRYAGTNTGKYRDKHGKTVFGKDAQGRWDKTGTQYMPRFDVKGARATALAAYNLGPTSMDYMLDKKKKLTGKSFKYKYKGKTISVTEEKLEEVRGYLGRYVAEGELTKQEILDAFPEMKGNIDKYITAWHDVNKSRQRR
jgi:hypothetical protein